MRKATYLVVALLALGLLLTLVSLSRMDLERLIACAAADDASRIPSPACMFYLERFTDAGDAGRLEAGPGLAYAFEVPDDDARRAIMERLLEIGVDIDSPSRIDELTPLNAAILLNDPALVEFLIRHGADTQARDAASGMDARQYLQFLQERDRATDRSEVSAVLDRGAPPM